MEGILVPITMFVSIALVLSAWLYFRYRARSAVQQTVQVAIEKGHELSPELLDRLGQPQTSGYTDLRRGVIAVSLGVAFAVFALVLDDMEATRALLGVAAFPFIVGVAYLALWRFASDRDT